MTAPSVTAEKRQERPLQIGQRIFREWCAYHGAVVDVEMAAGLCKRIEAAIIEERRVSAAAPDMLAGLHGLVKAWVNPADGSEFETGEVPELDAARAAIAKAEGR